MSTTFEKILAWKLLPRAMMAVMTWMYIEVLFWFMALDSAAMTSQATALTATVTGALTGSFAVWINSEK